MFAVRLVGSMGPAVTNAASEVYPNLESAAIIGVTNPDHVLVNAYDNTNPTLIENSAVLGSAGPANQ